MPPSLQRQSPAYALPFPPHISPPISRCSSLSFFILSHSFPGQDASGMLIHWTFFPSLHPVTENAAIKIPAIGNMILRIYFSPFGEVLLIFRPELPRPAVSDSGRIW